MSDTLMRNNNSERACIMGCPDGYSIQQQRYLKKQRRQLQIIRILRLLLFFFFLGLWEVSASLHWIDSFIFSSPSRIIKTFLSMLRENQLLMHIGTTLMETLASFLLVVVISVLLSVFLWLFPIISRVIDPYLVVLNSLPKSALAPLLIVWLGANSKTIIVAGMSVAIFGSIISLYSGFQEIDPDEQKLIYTLGGGKLQTLTKVILPASVPCLFSVMKVNIGLCLVGVVIGEFIGARQGLGYLIIYSSQVFKLDWMLMSIVLLCIIAMMLYLILCAAEKKYGKIQK